jgi:hypothetical protein
MTESLQFRYGGHRARASSGHGVALNLPHFGLGIDRIS